MMRKRILSFALAAVLALSLLPGVAFAAGGGGGSGTPLLARGYCGREDDGRNLEWDLMVDGMLDIHGEGNMMDFSNMDEGGGYEGQWRGKLDQIRAVVLNGVTGIGAWAFQGCRNLERFEMNWDSEVFSIVDGVLFNLDQTELVLFPPGRGGDYEIPDGVTTISHSSFAGCSGLTSLTIPNSVTAIDERAFSGCSGLTSLKIPDHVGRIEDNAFSGCSGLTSLTIPSSVRVIGNYAFSGCIGLKDVYCHIVDLSNLYIGGTLFVGGYIFEHADVSKATLHVPASAIADYKRNDHWKEFGSIVAL